MFRSVLLTALPLLAEQQLPDPENPDRQVPRPVLVSPGPEVTYGELADRLDAVTEAGFKDGR